MSWYRRIRAALRPIRRQFRDLRADMADLLANAAWLVHRRPRPHGLNRPLVVSLTSYPPRFPTLERTLRRLMRQSVKADALVLWIAQADAKSLPPRILALRRKGLTIEITDDLHSFKKIVPAIARYPDCFIATADDDVCYGVNWLRDLVDGYDPRRREIPCGRAHRIAFKRNGAPKSYARWRREVRAGECSASVIATGIGGVLYPPGSLDPLVTSRTLFERLAPSSDDLWLYWMARRAGWRFRKIGPRRAYLCWSRSQDVALLHKNAGQGGANDWQIARLAARFGPAWREDYDRPAEGAHA